MGVIVTEISSLSFSSFVSKDKKYYRQCYGPVQKKNNPESCVTAGVFLHISLLDRYVYD